MRRGLTLVFLSLLTVLLFSVSLIRLIPAPYASAATPQAFTAAANPQQNKGLYLSPVRNYLTLSPGQEVTRAFTVANLTDRPITVSISVGKFSVTGLGYDYVFSKTDNDWVRPIENTVELQPYKSRQVTYRVSIPLGATIGGYYYTLLAASDLSREGFAGTARVASMLYLTIDGELRRTSQIVSSSLPRLVISPDIAYRLRVKNTGNIHYFAGFTASVDGLFYHNQPAGVSRLLMPGAARDIENSIPSPLLPGIYIFTYTYAPDQGNSLGGSQYFIYLPPWSWVLALILGFVAYRLIRRSRQKKTARAPRQ